MKVCSLDFVAGLGCAVILTNSSCSPKLLPQQEPPQFRNDRVPVILREEPKIIIEPEVLPEPRYWTLPFIFLAEHRETIDV